MPVFGNILPILRSYSGWEAELIGLERSLLSRWCMRMTIPLAPGWNSEAIGMDGSGT
jgi:hypothetical protein